MTAAIGFQVTFDVHDAVRQAEFWAQALRYVLEPPPEGFASWDAWCEQMEIPKERWNDVRALVDPDGQGPRLLFLTVPEGKTAKNRMHLDVNVGQTVAEPELRAEAVATHVQALIGAGATVIAEREEFGHSFTVMADPEGNEFCVQ